MPKNIVICLDGTGNEFGDRNSNVVKLYRTLVHASGKQIAYYHPGLGTMGATGAWTKASQGITKLLGKAFGYGVAQHIGEAYKFLMDNYEPGDSVFTFGFSRGAYMARCLCSLLYMYGLGTKGNDALIPYITKMLKTSSEDRFGLAQRFKKTFSRRQEDPSAGDDNFQVHFVGLWDTVSSVGSILNPLRIPYTAISPNVQVGRHAVSIDERRAFFRQNLWNVPAGRDFKQVWFAGVHSDVGGGYQEAQSGLAKIALQWMLREAEDKGLLIDHAARDRVLGVNNKDYVKPDPTVPMHDELPKWLWAEIIPRRGWFAVRGPQGVHYERRWFFPLARRRSITWNPTVHRTVYERIDAKIGYNPPNVPPRDMAIIES